MSDVKNACRAIVAAALNELLEESAPGSAAISESDVSLQTPPDPALGDIGAPMFAYAKSLRMGPPAIAGKVVKIINDGAASGRLFFGAAPSSIGEFCAEGPYVNLRLDKSSSAAEILRQILEQGVGYGSSFCGGRKHMEGRRIMVEYSSPNTNKPLHLGHLRNDALGESVSRILKLSGAEVFKVNIINDRGVHICKSMLAYMLFHKEKGETPQSLGMKGDHFVGQCYVEFDRYSKENPDALSQAEELLVKWEGGDAEVRALWQTMNDWAVGGIRATYARTGVSFDKLYYESETYLKGREVILGGLERGVFFRAEDGSVRIDVSAAVGGTDGREHEKVLLRKDGTSVYITQDIGTAISRHDDWAFNQMVYVVASEQIYHFKVLFFILKTLGFGWAEKLRHLSYGLVNLPNGRMKSREGTVVDADDLLDRLHAAALSEIKEKGRDAEVDDADAVAESVALAALHYYLLQTSPVKDMVFNPEESLSFNGNTGPYLQYMGARIASILRKADEEGFAPDEPKSAAALLSSPEEWDLIRALGDFPEAVAKSAEQLDPSVMTGWLYEAARLFGKFYQQCPILSAPSESLLRARLCLCKCTLSVMKTAMDAVLVPYLEKM